MTLLTSASILGGILAPVRAAFPDLESMSAESVDAICESVQREVEVSLGMRFDVTRLVPWSGAGLPALAEGEESESPYQWPGRLPGDGFARFKPRVRPIQTVESITLRTPGSLVAAFEVPLDWIQVDRLSQEILICPTQGVSVLGSLVGGGLGLGLFGSRAPNAVSITYTAGLGPAGLREWPQLRRLLELRTAVALLAKVSMYVNPSAVSSVSADGLSQSRSSGYVFKDMEERLREEADEIQRVVMDRWDGLMPLVL